MKNIPLSILDLAIVKQGGTAQSAIQETVSFAQHAEELGFERFWMAEHHNMEHIASAATSVLIGHVADIQKVFEWVRAVSCCPITVRL